MEKITSQNSTNEVINSTLTLTNRKNLSLTNVTEIISSNDTNILLKISNSKVLITGKDINITKLDVSSGLLEASGLFDCVKYDKSQGDNIFKRIFK